MFEAKLRNYHRLSPENDIHESEPYIAEICFSDKRIPAYILCVSTNTSKVISSLFIHLLQKRLLKY